MHIHAEVSPIRPRRRAAVVGGVAVLATALVTLVYAYWPAEKPAQTDFASAPPLEWRTRATVELDAALAAYDDGDRVQAAELLREAESALRIGIQGRAASATGTLAAAASDLAAIALEVEKGRVRERATVAKVVARAHLAQAEYHRSLAAFALQSAKLPTAGLELAIAADHFERAQVDAGASTSAATAAVKSVRALSVDLLRGSAPANAADRIRRFGNDIQRTVGATRGAG